MPSLYVQYGSGFSPGSGWRNFDASPTLRIERLPIVGSVLGSISGNPQTFPSSVEYGDICKGLPIADGTVRGVYASHVLNMLSYDEFRDAIKNTFRMLSSRGLFRLVVPDLEERARRYVQAVSNGNSDANAAFMKATHLGIEERAKGFLGRARTVYGRTSSLWIWDEPSMKFHLERTGFVDVRRCDFGDSDDPMFARVEETGRFFDPAIGMRELAISARKP